MTTNDDLKNLTDSDLAATLRSTQRDLDAVTAERTRLSRRIDAINAERLTRTRSMVAATQPTTVHVGTPADGEGDARWPRVHRELAERFPVGVTVRYGRGAVEWVVDWLSIDVNRPALTMRNPSTAARNSSRYVGLFDLGNLTRIDGEA
jgi:hypothetical protein